MGNVSKERIARMVKSYNKDRYSHVIIYVDHWDYECLSSGVGYDENVETKMENIKACGSPGMFTIEEVYNLNLDIDAQLDEKRAFHIEYQPSPKILLTENAQKALAYAIKKHKGQMRKDNTPYINHPLRVARYVQEFKESKAMEILIMSAYLHDTLEDTDTTYYDLIENFGIHVASIVLELTSDEDLKKELGKERYLELKMKNMSSWALVIKLCDRLDNTSDLLKCNEEFRKRYSDETVDILNFIIQNRELSKSHISIIKSIIGNIAPMYDEDDEKYSIIESIKDSFINSPKILEKQKREKQAY